MLPCGGAVQKLPLLDNVTVETLFTVPEQPGGAAVGVWLTGGLEPGGPYTLHLMGLPSHTSYRVSTNTPHPPKFSKY